HRGRRGLRAHVFPFSTPQRAPPPAGRHALGRRAADARRLARPHAQAAPAPARRAFVRPRAANRPVPVRDPARHPRKRTHRHAARRAECGTRLATRRPRVFARDRARRHVGHGRIDPLRRIDPPLVPRLLGPEGSGAMNVLLHQILSGLATGGIYASVALALVMIYQATQLVNFAQGEMAMFCTYIAWALIQAGVPYWGAFALTVVGAFVLGVVIERVIIRPVENAPILAVVIVFIALLVIFNSLAGWIFTYTIKPFPSPFPEEPLFGNSYVSSHELGSMAITLVVLLLLFAFFRFTPLGLAMRAAEQNPVSSRLVGIRVGWMLALGWGLAAAIGAIAGMMVAPTVFLEPNMMGGILLYAFAGALLGGIDSPGGAVLGGFIVGALENVVGAYVGSELKLTVALAVIIGVLVVPPSGLFG